MIGCSALPFLLPSKISPDVWKEGRETGIVLCTIPVFYRQMRNRKFLPLSPYEMKSEPAEKVLP